MLPPLWLHLHPQHSLGPLLLLRQRNQLLVSSVGVVTNPLLESVALVPAAAPGITNRDMLAAHLHWSCVAIVRQMSVPSSKR